MIQGEYDWKELKEVIEKNMKEKSYIGRNSKRLYIKFSGGNSVSIAHPLDKDHNPIRKIVKRMDKCVLFHNEKDWDSFNFLDFPTFTSKTRYYFHPKTINKILLFINDSRDAFLLGEIL